jgi:hypothetical protein
MESDDISAITIDMLQQIEDIKHQIRADEEQLQQLTQEAAAVSIPERVEQVQEMYECLSAEVAVKYSRIAAIESELYQMEILSQLNETEQKESAERHAALPAPSLAPLGICESIALYNTLDAAQIKTTLFTKPRIKETSTFTNESELIRYFTMLAAAVKINFNILNSTTQEPVATIDNAHPTTYMLYAHFIDGKWML